MKYKANILTLGGLGHPKTEILQADVDGISRWSVIDIGCFHECICIHCLSIFNK